MKTKMKIALGTLLMSGLLSSCGNAELANTESASLINLNNTEAKVEEAGANTTSELSTPTGDTPTIDFKELKTNFGTINQGDKFEYDFEFTNNGDAPLLITNAKGSCGCTVPNYTREPIAPGVTDKIHVVFNSAGKRGKQHKTVTLQTNASTTPVILHLEGTVLVPAAK